ncbi:hypothetical protein HBH56_197920 [Parastagonospora nodorum]|nr:hypothetical protein HBH56_197920 [Parastagonospora nodorum]KAH3924587.1 hypothetical protein HBH54_190880 [Parastagonospora nodorum]KAH4130797.1 hypothetical protein HBH45_195320 [Parastagonospora nodorum]KAH4150368.1 hypothetical protein HBH44_181350 [Parastagonospora nodorum]KAH4560259.1 hypothetical protein HBH84_195990 [Parastagonospora nodorum]
MQSGTGIYNIETGRASALAADGIAGDCFASAGEHTATIVGRCMFIGGLLAGYVLVELAVPVYLLLSIFTLLLYAACLGCPAKKS